MIEDLIYQAIKAIPISIKLAHYAGEPAVFYQNAPNDTAAGWQDDIMYPRIDYGVDWQANSERKTAGTLLINIWCTNQSTTPPEEFAAALQTELSDLFITDVDGTHALIWSMLSYFDVPEEKEPCVVGCTLSFDVLAFPNQETMPPDPVWALNSYFDKGIKVIGHDGLESIWRPTDDHPAVYVHIISNNLTHVQCACAWMEITLALNVIAPSPQVRESMLQDIAHKLSLRGELLLNDGSPFLLNQIRYLTAAEAMKDGQMTIIGRYGVLPAREPSEPLNHIIFD